MKSRTTKKFWLAAATHHREEVRAAANVERQGFEFFLPYVEEFVVNRFRKRLMFPGYIFVKQTAGWQVLNNTRGISSVIMIDGVPSKIRASEIQELRALEDESGVVRLRPHSFSEGDLLAVGPGGRAFSGLQCVCQGMSAVDRCKVLFTILGRKVVAELDPRVLSAA